MPALPRSTADRSCFFSGSERHPVYVDHLPGNLAAGRKPPVLMLHGGFHTGAAFLSTPDRRPGWAPFFAARGHDVYVPDWPGHGRSPARVPLATLSTRDAAEALATLVQEVGPAIVLAHSAAGPMAWWMAEQCPEGVLAVVGIAPGPPANIQKVLPDDPAAVEALKSDAEAGCPVYASLERPTQVEMAFVREFWANSPQFPQQAVEAYARSIVPESARILNERFNIGGAGLRVERPEVVARRPILIVTGECDPRHPRAVDARLADYLHADFLWLPDAGCRGNGHMLMSEASSDEVAGLICDWLGRRVL